VGKKPTATEKLIYFILKFQKEGIRAMGREPKEPTAIEKLDYVYKYIDREEGKKEQALIYLNDIAKYIDTLIPELYGRQCRIGDPLPIP
jgi:hypothetical protein